MGEGSVGDVDQALEVEVDHPVPFLGGRILDRPEQHHTGVVDDYVEAAKLADRAVAGGYRLSLIGDVGLDRKGGMALAPDFGGKSLESLQAPGCQRHLCPPARQRVCGCLPNTTAGTGD